MTPRPRLTILVKLLLAFALPTLALFGGFAFLAHEVARRDLEAELGTRLEAIAATAALQIRGKYLVPLTAGDEDDRAYQNALRKLQAIVEATGVARIYVFDAQFTSRLDTAAEMPIGGQHFQAELDRLELESVFASGRAVSSVLFSSARPGSDAPHFYKAGYAPVRASENEPEIVLALGVDAPAAYFQRLAALRRSLLWYGMVLALLVLSISVVMATRITRPVRILADAARRIGRGELDRAVPRPSRDELGLLAQTMDEMRVSLAAHDARMQQMLAGVAHEVRNPLAGIQLFVGILRDELDAGDERRGHVERIESEVMHLEAVVGEFLDYARRPTLQAAAIDLAALAREVLDLARSEASTRQVELVLEAPPAAIAQGDALQLRRALLNLLKNAIQAAGAAEGARRAGIAIELDAQTASVTVHNTGAAIAPELRERIFEPFFTTREKGIGLGLAFVREILADHGARLQLTSERDDTRFCFTLPRVAVASSRASDHASDPAVAKE